MRFRDAWLSQLPASDSLQTISTAIELSPPPLIGLAKLSRAEIRSKLDESFDQLFVPTEQICQLLAGRLGDIRSHISRFYTDRRDFMELAYSHVSPLPDDTAAMCITGLAGVGKSQLHSALIRLMGKMSPVLVDANHSPFHFQPLRVIRIEAKSSLKSILNAILYKGLQERDLPINEVPSVFRLPTGGLHATCFCCS